MQVQAAEQVQPAELQNEDQNVSGRSCKFRDVLRDFIIFENSQKIGKEWRRKKDQYSIGS